MNPFELLDGVRVEAHLGRLQACFDAALPQFGILPSIVAEAMEEIYKAKGWRLTDRAVLPSSEGGGDGIGVRLFPTLREMYAAVIRAAVERGYAGEMRDNIRAAAGGRLGEWLLVVVFGAGTLSAGLYLNRERVAADLANWHPPVPLGPISRSMRAVETVRANIRLSPDGTYRATVKAVEGELDPGLEFTPLDRARLHAYREKYSLSDAWALPFDGGHLVLTGTPALRVKGLALDASQPRNLLHLRDVTSAHPYLSDQRGRSDRRWGARWRYAVLPRDDSPESDLRNLPIRLVPFFQARGNHHHLGLEVQFAHRSWGLPEGQDSAKVERLELVTPMETFGQPGGDGEVSIGDADGVGRMVWRDVPLPASDQDNRRRRIFWVTYERLDTIQASVRGHLTVSMRRLISGLKGVRYYSSLGHPVERLLASELVPTPVAPPPAAVEPPAARPRRGLAAIWDGIISGRPAGQPPEPAPADEPPAVDPLSLPGAHPDEQAMAGRASTDAAGEGSRSPSGIPFSVETRFEIDFELALNSLAVHELLSSQVRLPEMEIPNFRVDHGLVLELVEAIACPAGKPDRAWHVRSVMENPARLGTAHGEQRRHLWDISGRRYDKTFPVDFHVVIGGHSEGEASAQPGKYSVEVLVQGAVCDEATKAKVQSTLENLIGIAGRVFGDGQTTPKEGGKHVS